MKKIMLFMVSILLLGCTKEDNPARENEDFNSLYGGIPYKGTVQGRISLDEGNALDLSGDGSIALIEATSDSVSIVFLSDIDDLGEINIKIRGEFNSKSFHMGKESSGIYFRVVDQIINGKFTSETQDMVFEGKLEKESGQMEMVAIFKEETESFPEGTRLELNFDTSRKITENDDDGPGCQMRMVPIWDPNGMTMGMVPDC
ncbi:hypothetical protein H8B06_01290 [Sphingobacterium sp. DN00404]|uniref:Lipoprotein n=1 Tax=Sphingobacterium micropteri TaxID=2763501 RepID=A0ABR7YJE5_9SPHI|nr:hypothetical protein [Sphingobacterium micropteri]MBD1431444.1 hypothetical protein [Sphingobacterium micropteri]